MWMTTLELVEKKGCGPLISSICICFCIELQQGVQKILFLPKYLTKKRSKCLHLIKFKANVRRIAYTEKKHVDLWY